MIDTLPNATFILNPSCSAFGQSVAILYCSDDTHDMHMLWQKAVTH